MTIDEKRLAVSIYCMDHTCSNCKLCDKWKHGNDQCMLITEASEDDLDLAIDIIKDNYKSDKNPYWERITQMADRQREKGISTYGQGLEQFTTPDALKRIDYIQEELIDALMYLEWLKEKLKGDIENGTKEENT